jgi:hypothetical protein
MNDLSERLPILIGEKSGKKAIVNKPMTCQVSSHMLTFVCQPQTAAIRFVNNCMEYHESAVARKIQVAEC